MKVLVVGKGAREHALAKKLHSSPLLTSLYVWPGNAAMAGLGATAVDLPPSADNRQVSEAAKALGVDLVVVGPEVPLAEGLADALLAQGVKVFGPRQKAAQLESSKAFSKEMMRKAGVPTAPFELARGEQDCRRLALAMLARTGGTVLKASGLAAGKGVFVCTDKDDIEEGLRHLYHTDMTKAAGTVVVEETLKGREVSYFTFIGVGGATGLGFAVDFKRLEDQDRGPNTGGMGCYAPVPWLPVGAEKLVEERVVRPLLAQLEKEGIEYTGCLYVGIMWTETGPEVVEFNVRLGDPEAQVLSVYDDRDWLALMAFKAGLPVDAAALAKASAKVTHKDRAVAVVMAAKGYPFGSASDSAKGHLPLSLFTEGDVFAASVSPGVDGQLATGAGRVLTVCARGHDFAAARERAYGKVKIIAHQWPDARFRRDIAERAVREEGVGP